MASLFHLFFSSPLEGLFGVNSNLSFLLVCSNVLKIAGAIVWTSKHIHYLFVTRGAIGCRTAGCSQHFFITNYSKLENSSWTSLSDKKLLDGPFNVSLTDQLHSPLRKIRVVHGASNPIK